MDKNIISSSNGKLSIGTSPNPSSNNFRLKIASSSDKSSVDVKVTDVQERIVESRKGMPGQTMEIGVHYQPGIYFAQVTQGSNKVVIRIVKQ